METPSLAYNESLQSTAMPWILRAWIFLIGLVWSLGTGFSIAYSGDEAPAIYQGVVLIVVFVMACTSFPRYAISSLVSMPVVLMFIHLLMVAISAMVNQSSTISVLHEALLIPTMMIMSIMVIAGWQASKAVLLGLMMGGLCFTLVHLRALEPANLLDPGYRLTLFLNPNGVALITGATAVLLFAASIQFHAIFKRLAQIACVFCLVVCYATKSRAGLLAALTGMVVILQAIWRTMPPTKKMFSTLIFVVCIGVLVFGNFDALSDLASSLDLFSRHRSIFTGTGRYELWAYSVQDIWLPHIMLGVGPGRTGDILMSVFNVSSPHNGLLGHLCDSGLLGAFPFFILIVYSFKGWYKIRHDLRYLPFVAVFVSCFVNSLAEEMFFSMGNPGSLMFTLAVATLVIHRGYPSAPRR